MTGEKPALHADLPPMELLAAYQRRPVTGVLLDQPWVR
jgi:hypothetical protein